MKRACGGAKNASRGFFDVVTCDWGDTLFAPLMQMSAAVERVRMANDMLAGESLYPALKAAVEAVGHGALAMVKEPGGLFITEDISEDPNTLQGSTCLFVQWAINEMRERYGKEKAIELLTCLQRGIELNGREIDDGG